MTFWNWRRGPGPIGHAGDRGGRHAPDLAPIELYTADSRIVGWIAPNGQRVTDLLNSPGRAAPVAAQPRTARRAVAMPSRPDAARAARRRTASGRRSPTARVILAMPPEWRASRQLRLHRRLRRAACVAGPFSVTGNVHLPPGVEVGLHLLRTQRFIPLTDAYILHNGEPPFEHVVSVVIVNTAHVAQIVPLVTLA